MPSKASSLRFIHAGKVLTDEALVGGISASITTSIVVHVSVRPASVETLAKTDAKRSKVGGSGCCVVS